MICFFICGKINSIGVYTAKIDLCVNPFDYNYGEFDEKLKELLHGAEYYGVVRYNNSTFMIARSANSDKQFIVREALPVRFQDGGINYKAEEELMINQSETHESMELEVALNNLNKTFPIHSIKDITDMLGVSFEMHEPTAETILVRMLLSIDFISRKAMKEIQEGFPSRW